MTTMDEYRADPNKHLTARQAHALVRAAGNTDGLYGMNIGQGGGTAGALDRRGLIARRKDGPQGDGWYLTAAGRSVAGWLADTVPAAEAAPAADYPVLRSLLRF